MSAFVAGVLSVVVAAVLFWRCLPRNGKVHPVIATTWEPMIGVGFTSGMALGLTLMLLGLSEMLGQ